MSGEPCGQRARCGKVDGPSKPGPYNDPIIGCLLETVVDAMTGMVTQVRLPRRGDGTSSSTPYDRAPALRGPGYLQPSRHRGDATA